MDHSRKTLRNKLTIFFKRFLSRFTPGHPPSKTKTKTLDIIHTPKIKVSHDLPFEIQVEIIKKLPIKSVIQFRSVSKRWKSVIDSSDFIAGYTVLNHAQPQHLLISYIHPLFEEKTYVSIVDDNTFPQNKFSPTVPFINLLRDSFIVGTSHGVFCLFGYYQNHQNQDDFEYRFGTGICVLWNPSIRKSVVIDVGDVDMFTVGGSALGFGVCPATCDPKIVKINDTRKTKGVTCSSRWQVEVFSLSSGVWRASFGNIPDKLVENKWPRWHETLDGFIYWFGSRDNIGRGFNIVISFDLSSEEFREIRLPNELAVFDPGYLYLFKLNDSLVVLQDWVLNGLYQVWNIMENGDSKSLTKGSIVHKPCILSDILEFRSNGELMMSLVIEPTVLEVELLISYHQPFSEHINFLGIVSTSDTSSVYLYTESLILLNQVDRLVDEDEEISVL